MKYLIIIVYLFNLTALAIAQDEGSNRKNAGIAYNKAVEAIAKENYQEAYTHLTQSLTHDPNWADVKLTLAKVKIELGMTDEAIEDFKKLLNEDPDNGEYWFYAGYLEFTGTYDSTVLQNCNKASSLGFTNPELFYCRGINYFLAGDYQSAVTDFTRTIELDNNHYLAYHDRGSAKRLLGDMQGALYDFRTSTDIFHPNPIAFNNMGSVKIILGDYEGAIQDYSVAVNLDPEFVTAFNNRGAAHFYLGNIQQALDDFNNALMINNNYVPAVINKASALTKNLDYIEAITLFDGVISSSPQNGIAYLNRGLVKELTGDLAGACEDWKMAVLNGVKEAENFIKECK